MSEKVQQFGSRIRAFRRQRNMTQADLGRLANLDQGYISRIENGMVEGTPSQLSAIAKALGVTVSDILGDNVKKPEGDYSAAAADPPLAILANDEAPSGLRDLAQDLPLVQALRITPEEWRALASFKLPGNVTKEGYMQFLITLRNVESTTQLSA